MPPTRRPIPGSVPFDNKRRVLMPNGRQTLESILQQSDVKRYFDRMGYKVANSPTPNVKDFVQVGGNNPRGYWENPQRVARYHDYIRSQPEGWKPPEWLPVKEVESAFKYLEYRNKDKPWNEWKYLPDEDDGAQFLRNLQSPPEEYLFPKEYAEKQQQKIDIDKQAQEDPRNNVGLWETLDPYQQTFETISTPQAVVGEDPTGRPLGSKLVANTGRSVLAGIGGGGLAAGGAGLVNAALAAIAGSGGTLAIPIGAAAVVGGVAYALATMYQLSTGDEIPVIGKTISSQGRIFNKPAEETEKIFGVVEQVTQADEDFEAVLKELPSAYRAGEINYESNKRNYLMDAWTNLAIATGAEGATEADKPKDGQVYAWDRGLSDPQDLPKGIKYGVEALDDVRTRLTAVGEDKEAQQAIIQEYTAAFGAQGLLNDFAFQSVADPLNFIPSVGAGVMNRVASLTDNAAMKAAFPKVTATNVVVDALPTPVNMIVQGISGGRIKGAPSVLDGINKYQTFVRTGFMPGANIDTGYVPPKDYSNLEKTFGNLDQSGMPKEFMPAKDAGGGFGKIGNLYRWLTDLTPEAKAKVMQGNMMDHFSRMLEMAADDPVRQIEIVKAMAQADPNMTGEALKVVLNPPDVDPLEINPRTFNSPIGSALGTAIQNIVDSGMIDELYLAKWKAPAQKRMFLNKAAELLELTPAELLTRLNKDVDVASTLKAKASELGIEGYDTLTNQGLKELMGVFTGKNALPFNETLFRMELSRVLDDGISDFLIKRFGIKQDSAFMRVSHTLKNVQSLMVLGLNPAYLINNTINNIVTRATDGIWGYMSGKEISDTLTRYGVEPYRTDAGLGKYGTAAEYDLDSMEDSGRAKISKIKAGDKDLINAANNFTGKLSNKLGIFKRISGLVERSESRQAYMTAFRQMQNGLWKPGIGFQKFAPMVEAKLDQFDPEIKQRLYSIARSSANLQEFEDGLFKAGAPIRAEQVIDVVADTFARQHETIIQNPDTYRELLVNSGIADLLNRELPKAKTTADVDRVFDNVIAKSSETARKMLANELKVRVEDAFNRVKQGGLDEAVGLYSDMVMAYKKEWAKHFLEIEEMQNSFPGMDWEQRNAAWKSQNRWDTMRFEDLNSWEQATWKGVFDALGKSNDPMVLEFIDNYKNTRENWVTFYKKRSSKYDKLFDHDYTAVEFSRVNDEVAKLAATAYEAEDMYQSRADDLYIQIIEMAGGDAGKATTYRTAMRVMRDEMIDAMSTFRRDLVEKPPQSRTERMARWNKFINEVYIPLIGELKRVEVVGAQEIKDIKPVDNANTASEVFGENPSERIPVPMYEGKALSELAHDYLNSLLESVRDEYKHAVKNNKKFVFGDLPDDLKAEVDNWYKSVKSDMPSAKLASMKYAELQRDKALLNYNRQTGLDQVLSTVYPYQFWYTHSMVNWASRMLERPAVYAMYYRWRQMQERLEQEGMPKRLTGRVRINAPYLPDWTGGGLFIDPSRQLFPFSQFNDPVDNIQRSENDVKYRAYDVLDELVKQGEITKKDADVSKQTMQGAAWDQAYQAALSESNFSDPVSLASMMLQPGMYITIPNSLLKKQPEKISPTPILRYSQAVQTALSGTAFDALGKGIGLLGYPEKKLREKAMTPAKAAFGEYGDYYIDRQLTNMVADGEIGMREAKIAMMERAGKDYEAALERVKQEVALRAPGLLPVIAMKNGANAPQVAFSLFTSMFPAGLLPSGELDIIGKTPEYNAAWQKYKLGDTEALTRFYDENPEFEARTALRDEPEERLRQFLISEIWDRYNSLVGKNKSEAVTQMGGFFQDAFINKETRSYDAVSDEQLAQWAYLLGGYAPKTVQVPQPDAELSMWPDAVVQAYQTYTDERNSLFPNYKAIQEQYFALPKGKRRNYLKRFPELKQYWQWKDDYLANNPAIAPVLASNTQEYNMQESITGTTDINSFDPDLQNQIMYAVTTGGDLTPGAWMALEYQWEKMGKPYDDFQEWAESEVLSVAK